MEKSKLEIFTTAMGIECEIEIDADESRVAFYKKGDLYVKFFGDKHLSKAIEKATNHYRESLNDNIK